MLVLNKEKQFYVATKNSYSHGTAISAAKKKKKELESYICKKVFILHNLSHLLALCHQGPIFVNDKIYFIIRQSP